MPNSDDRNGTVVYKADTVADVLMTVCSLVLTRIRSLATGESKENGGNLPKSKHFHKHTHDIVSFIVCVGIVDKLAVYCSSVHKEKCTDSFFLLHAIQFLTTVVEIRHIDEHSCISESQDTTSLLTTLKATELVGTVSMLYALLFHHDVDQNGCIIHPDIVNITTATLKFFNRVGTLNLTIFQNILGAEGVSLQVRHIISFLLKFCVQSDTNKELLHRVVEFIGFFAIHHRENQMILQSGSTPTVLQQLSNLPFAYFSNPKLTPILFPTLIACCVNNSENKHILDQEMSYQLLEDFKNSEESKNIPLMNLLTRVRKDQKDFN